MYLAYIDWPYGIEPIGIFSSEQLAKDFYEKYFLGKAYSSAGKYTWNMLETEERELDPT